MWWVCSSKALTASPRGARAGARPGLGAAGEVVAATHSLRRDARLPPWLEVVREYGVALVVSADGRPRFSASATSRPTARARARVTSSDAARTARMEELERVAPLVAARLYEEGTAALPAWTRLEHSGGLHPLLEVTRATRWASSRSPSRARSSVGADVLEVEDRVLIPVWGLRR